MKNTVLKYAVTMAVLIIITAMLAVLQTKNSKIFAGESGLSSAGNKEAGLPPNIYPADAFLVTVDNKEKLQQELDLHRAVRLLPGDYGAGITLRSGQQIFGLPGTKLGRIVIEPGSVGVLVNNVLTNILFPASDSITKGNTIFRIGGAIMVKGGTLEDNLFVDSTSVDVDVQDSGYLRNNKFIRAPGQIQGWNMLKFRANPKRPSTGNVFLWMNACCNEGPTTDISGVPELTIAVVDAELWSWKTKEHTPLFVTGPMERLNLFALQGGRYDDNMQEYGLIDSAAREVRVFGLACGYRGQAPDLLPAKIVLREGNEQSLFADSMRYSFSIPATNCLQVRAFEQFRGVPETGMSPVSGVNPNQPVIIEPAEAKHTQLAALKKMILQTGRRMRPWNRPGFDTVPDPAGDNWDKDLAAQPDHTRMIQGRLEKEGIVVLAPGKYYISESLGINGKKGIVGSGMDKTVIIAKDPNMSMFVFDSQDDTHAISLANLTLQGGRAGVHLRSKEIKGYINRSFLSHLTFRNMTEAGIYVDMPEEEASLDNNLISFCNFVKCAAGLKQRPNKKGNGGFIDKLVVYRCQFIQCGIGIDFPARRGNNACAYIECRFEKNTEAAAKLVNNTTASFANCDFFDNCGDPVVDSNFPVYFISCCFRSNDAAKSLIPSQSIAEGCTFESGISAETMLIKKPSRNHFYNCSVKMMVRRLNDGLLLNNTFFGRPDLNQVGVQVFGGKATVLVPGASKPGPQLLVTGAGQDKIVK